MSSIGEINDRDSALIPSLHEDVPPGHRNERAVGRDAVLVFGLRRGKLAVRLEGKLVSLPRTNHVGAPMSPAGLVKMRGEPITRAFCGASSGTRMMSIRKSEVFGSFSGRRAEQPASSPAGRGTATVPWT